MPIVNVAAADRYCGMSDSEKLLDSDHESLPGPSVHSLPDVNSAHHTGNKDLVDTFSLFKTYLDDKIADKSPAGWKTVREYESDDLASDSEDEKRIRSAESRAIRSIKEKKRPHPYKTVTATVSAPIASMSNQNNVRQNNYQQPPFRTSRRREPSFHDICYNCNQLGHWRTLCPLFSTKPVAPGTSRQQC